MKYGMLALVALFVMQGQAAEASSDNRFQLAMGELASGNANAGYQLLAQVPPGDSHFVDSLVELQKIHYRSQDWQKFFAYAMFYRKKIVAQSGLLNVRMISLELMALAKHCRLAEAKAIGNGALAFGHEHELDTSEIESTLVHLHLTGIYPNTLKGIENTTRPPAVLAGELYWKIPAEELRLVSEPSQLRAIVQSRCKK